MASIYKPSNRKHYHTSFFIPTPNGRKKITRSTGKHVKKEAQHEANALEIAALRSAGAGDEKSQKIYSIVSKAAEDARSGMLNDHQARQYICEIVKISSGNDLPEFNIGEWLTEWLARQEGSSKATIQAYTTTAKQYREWLGDRADGWLQNVTTEDMRELRQWFNDGAGKARKASPTTVKNKMKCITAIYIEALKQGLVTVNPTTGLKKQEMPDPESREPFTIEEIQALLKHADNDEWRGLILIGAYTGLRLKDCAMLTWGAVDFQANQITTTTRKTKTEVKIYIAPPLLDFLINHPISDNSEDPILPTLAKRKTSGSTGISVDFGKLMEKAQIDRMPYETVAGRTLHKKSFHSLRHTLTSWMANANVAPEVRKKILGHKTDDVHAIYTHLGDETLEAAMKGIPKF